MRYSGSLLFPRLNQLSQRRCCSSLTIFMALRWTCLTRQALRGAAPTTRAAPITCNKVSPPESKATAFTEWPLTLKAVQICATTLISPWEETCKAVSPIRGLVKTISLHSGPSGCHLAACLSFSCLTATPGCMHLMHETGSPFLCYSVLPW